MIPINSIEIPNEFCAICANWYDGMGDMLYAVASTGGLTTGTIRPTDDDGFWASDEWWYYSLWIELSTDVGYARRVAEEFRDRGGDNADWIADAECLGRFEKWVDDVCERLEASYGLEG